MLLALTLALLGGSPRPDAGVARPEWLVQFEALRPQKPPLKFELSELDHLVRFCALGPARTKAELAKLEPFARYQLGRRMLLLAAVAPQLRPAVEALAAPAVREAVLARHARLEPMLSKPAEALTALAARLRAAVVQVRVELQDTLTDEERRQVVATRGFFSPAPPIDDPGTLVFTAQALDALADAVLGIRYEQTEVALPMGEEGKKLYGDHNTYIDEGKSYHAVQTPYADLARVMDAFALKSGDRIVDLGSGYGRICFYVAATRPGVECVGYEIVEQRVVESARVARALGFDQVTFEARDLTDPALTPVAAGFYFAYDPVNYRVVGKVLADLEALARVQPLRLAAVEGRGGFHALLRKQPWLKKVQTVATVRWTGMLPPIFIFESVAAAK